LEYHKIKLIIPVAIMSYNALLPEWNCTMTNAATKLAAHYAALKPGLAQRASTKCRRVKRVASCTTPFSRALYKLCRSKAYFQPTIAL
jgi:hypothetical protein